jgi:DNA-directed RNA polymerase specialized sigma24 family protein
MRHTTCFPDLHLLIDEADAAARRLHYKLGLPAADRDDLRQELLVDAVRRLRHFDPERASLGAFAGTVLRRHSARLADRIMRERRRQGGLLLSIDAATSTGVSLGETLIVAAADDCERADQRLTLASVLTQLDRHEQTLCAGVALFSIDHLVAHGLGSRASLYRRLHDLRCALTAHGLRVAA